MDEIAQLKKKFSTALTECRKAMAEGDTELALRHSGDAQLFIKKLIELDEVPEDGRGH